MYGVTERYSENIAKNVTFSEISGTITMTDGTVFAISDKNIKEGSLSINSKINSSGEFRAGGVCADELSISLLNYGNSAQSLDGAEIILEFRLYTDSSFTEYDSVPLGIYIVDGSTIKRQADTVKFKAYDRLVLFDRGTWEMTNSLYNLISVACGSCGVPFGMTQAEFGTLPNSGLTASIDTSRIQTQRDLLMYAGTLTNSFAKISRTGELVFVQLTCTQDEKNMVVPVREIHGNIRFKTEFSDSTARITSLVMNRNGARLTSRNKITSSGSDCLTLEWADNPLLSGLKDDAVRDVLTNAVSGIYRCINRAFKAEFSGDPALDIGDYVRLRGGQIDMSRGYGTGMITSQTWRYRGKHTIQCSMPSTVNVSSVSGGSGSDENSENRVQPKSQVEKEIDSLRAYIGTATELSDTRGEKYGHIKYTAGNVRFVNESGTEYGYIALMDTPEFMIAVSGKTLVDIRSNGFITITALNGTQLEISPTSGATNVTVTPGSGLGKKFRITTTEQTDGGVQPSISFGDRTLSFKSDGLYYNGTKIGG